ncbi:uncharacterized protein LOC115329471 [Ixodes scapularis]|uniref:uncharacterized protein LOC115329471 n=1 Tax=Ixodes scapularis TaxID=6945 RepID=UPI001A9E0D77|nr:uncharacterized protein LOC115329471 [Ixodes scapularis]
MFGIVKFSDYDDQVAVVPRSWYKDGYVAWPPEKNPRKLQQMVQNVHQPPDSWERLKCTAMDWFESYEKARRKLPRAEDTSDLQSDVERRRKKPMRWETDETDEDDVLVGFCASTSKAHGYLQPRKEPLPPAVESDDEWDEVGASSFEPPPTPPVVINEPPQVQQDHSSQKTHKENFRVGVKGHNVKRRHPYGEKHQSYHAADNQGMQKELFRLLHMVKAKQEEQSQQLDFIVAKLSQNAQYVEDSSDDIILDTFNMVEDFLSFDNSLESEEMKKKLKMHWKGCDGKSIYDALQRVLHKLMSDEVAVEFSFQGGKGKRKFCNLRSWTVLLECLLANKGLGATEYKVEKALKSWLAHAKERMEKRQPEK